MWTFNKKGCLKDFACTTDSDHDFGYSTCSLGTTTNGTLLFKGNLSTSIRDDGNTVRSGFCSFRTPRAMVCNSILSIVGFLMKIMNSSVDRSLRMKINQDCHFYYQFIEYNNRGDVGPRIRYGCIAISAS